MHVSALTEASHLDMDGYLVRGNSVSRSPLAGIVRRLNFVPFVEQNIKYLPYLANCIDISDGHNIFKNAKNVYESHFY